MGGKANSHWASHPCVCAHCCILLGIMLKASVFSSLSRGIWPNKGGVLKQGRVGREVGCTFEGEEEGCWYHYLPSSHPLEGGSQGQRGDWDGSVLPQSPPPRYAGAGQRWPKAPMLVPSLSPWTYSTALTSQPMGSAVRHGPLDSLCPWPGVCESQPEPRLYQRVAPTHTWHYQAYTFLDHAK